MQSAAFLFLRSMDSVGQEVFFNKDDSRVGETASHLASRFFFGQEIARPVLENHHQSHNGRPKKSPTDRLHSQIYPTSGQLSPPYKVVRGRVCGFF